MGLIELGMGPFSPGSPAAIESQAPVGYNTGGGGGVRTTLRPRTARLCAAAGVDNPLEVNCAATSVHDVTANAREIETAMATRKATPLRRI